MHEGVKIDIVNSYSGKMVVLTEHFKYLMIFIFTPTNRRTESNTRAWPQESMPCQRGKKRSNQAF